MQSQRSEFKPRMGQISTIRFLKHKTFIYQFQNVDATPSLFQQAGLHILLIIYPKLVREFKLVAGLKTELIRSYNSLASNQGL